MLSLSKNVELLKLHRKGNGNSDAKFANVCGKNESSNNHTTFIALDYYNCPMLFLISAVKLFLW